MSEEEAGWVCSGIEATAAKRAGMKLYVTKISLRIEVSIRGCSECKPGYEEVEFSKAR